MYNHQESWVREEISVGESKVVIALCEDNGYVSFGVKRGRGFNALKRIDAEIFEVVGEIRKFIEKYPLPQFCFHSIGRTESEVKRKDQLFELVMNRVGYDMAESSGGFHARGHLFWKNWQGPYREFRRR